MGRRGELYQENKLSRTEDSGQVSDSSHPGESGQSEAGECTPVKGWPLQTPAPIRVQSLSMAHERHVDHTETSNKGKRGQRGVGGNKPAADAGQVGADIEKASEKGENPEYSGLTLFKRMVGEGREGRGVGMEVADAGGGGVERPAIRRDLTGRDSGKRQRVQSAQPAVCAALQGEGGK